MGVSHSDYPRSVNIENQSPIGIVEVSEDVVKRLKLGLVQDGTSQAKVKTSESREIEKNELVKNEQRATNSKVVYVDQSSTLEEVRKQKEHEFQQLDKYWSNRLSQLEQNLNKTNKIMQEEYTYTVENVKKRFVTSQLSPSHKLSSLHELKAQLISCFVANPGEPLKCSEEVSIFINSVNKYRLDKLDSDNGNLRSNSSLNSSVKPVNTG